MATFTANNLLLLANSYRYNYHGCFASQQHIDALGHPRFLRGSPGGEHLRIATISLSINTLLESRWLDPPWCRDVAGLM
jgi:hypothetical protein